MRALLQLPLCAVLALPCAGCLVHEARVDAAGADLTAGRSAVGTTVHDGAPQTVRRGPLPFELPATWTLRDRDGHLLAGHGRALSPLPWWQRFPCDLAVDLWPADVVVTTTATITPVPIIARSSDDITAEARAHGYAQ